MNIFKSIAKGIKKVFSVFRSSAAQRSIETAVELSKVAIPIVIELGEYHSPSSSKVEDVLDLHKKYGIPVNSSYVEGRQSIGNALLNLATELLRRRLTGNQMNLKTNILNTAVQIAVTAVKAK